MIRAQDVIDLCAPNCSLISYSQHHIHKFSDCVYYVFHRPQAKIKYVFNGSRLQVEAAPSRRRKPRTLLEFPPEFLGQKSRNSRKYFDAHLPRLTRSGKSSTTRRASLDKFPANRKSHRKKRFLTKKGFRDARDGNEKRPPPSNNETNKNDQAQKFSEQSLDLYRTGPPSIEIPTPQTETPTSLMSTAKLRSLNLSSLRRLEQVCMAYQGQPLTSRASVTVLASETQNSFNHTALPAKFHCVVFHALRPRCSTTVVSSLTPWLTTSKTSRCKRCRRHSRRSAKALCPNSPLRLAPSPNTVLAATPLLRAQVRRAVSKSVLHVNKKMRSVRAWAIFSLFAREQ